MDPVPRRGLSRIPDISDSDMNRIKNLTLEDANQMPRNYLGGFKTQVKTSLGGDDGSIPLKPNPPGNLPFCYSPTAPCMCRGPRVYYPVKPYDPWASPDPKLYWGAEDPTRKEYSPSLRPVESTSYSTSNLRKLLANFN